MKKRILLSIAGLSLLLGGCGANQTQKKTDTHKEKAKTEKVKSAVASSTASSASSKSDSNDVAFGQKISNDEFYVMAYAKNEKIDLDKMLNGSKTWTFPSASIDDPSYTFCKEKNYYCVGNSSGSNEGETRLINVDNDNVTIAHLEAKTSKQDYAETTYQNLTFSKKSLISEFLTSKDKVNELAEITQNMKNNENQATKDINQGDSDSSSSSQSNGNADTKNLSTQQVCDWIKAYCQSDGSNVDVDPEEMGSPSDHDGYAVFEVWTKDEDGNRQLAGDYYRVDKNGNLQVAGQAGTDDMNSDMWQDTNFPYPGN